MKCYMLLNIKVISQYQFVCTRLSSAHTPTRKFVGVWALDKLRRPISRRVTFAKPIGRLESDVR